MGPFRNEGLCATGTSVDLHSEMTLESIYVPGVYYV